MTGSPMHPAYTKPWISGLRLDPLSDTPSLFCIQHGEDLLPVCVNRRVLACVSGTDIAGLLQRAGFQDLTGDRSLSVDVVYDIVSVLDVVSCQKVDAGADVADCLNFLLDCVKVTDGDIPEADREAFVLLADCATFTTQISEFLDAKMDHRSRVHRAIIWCLGWLLLHLQIVR